MKNKLYKIKIRIIKILNYRNFIFYKKQNDKIFKYKQFINKIYYKKMKL